MQCSSQIDAEVALKGHKSKNH